MGRTATRHASLVARLTACSSLALACGHRLAESSLAAPAPAPITQPPVVAGEVWGPDNVADTREIQQIFERTLIRDTGEAPLMRRDAHPKHHGCVQAVLRVDPSSLRAEHRHGLLAQPGEYQAWVRFSNGDTDPNRPDRQANFRGMAIKLMGVPYSSYLQDIGHEPDNAVHDLVLLNSPTFFMPDTEQYAKLMRAVERGGLPLALYSMAHPRLTRIIQRARTMKVGDVLDLDYHSATPYRLGSTSMRMTMASCEPKAQRPPRGSDASPDFLGERLAADLAERERCFVFYVQPNEDPQHNAIEDPTRTWPTKISPQIEVGRLTVLQQQGFREPEPMAWCEHLSFNPWRAPAANRPLGQANRVRLEVYTRQSALRHEHNGVPEPRPTRFEPPAP